jgi:hypothetical protein
MANVVKPCNAYAGGEAMRWAKSRYATGADGDNSYLVVPVPKKALISRVLLDTQVGQTGASTGTVSVGFTGNGEAQSDVYFKTAALVSAVGITELTATNAGAKYFETAGGAITIAIVKGTSAADYVGRVFVEYTVIH